MEFFDEELDAFFKGLGFSDDGQESAKYHDEDADVNGVLETKNWRHKDLPEFSPNNARTIDDGALVTSFFLADL